MGQGGLPGKRTDEWREFVEAETRLSAPRRDGKSLRHHLESVALQTGKRPPELDSAPPCPDGCWHVWKWFKDVAASRDAGESPQPITYRELHAWAQLTKCDPTPDEIELIRMADHITLLVWLEVHSNKQ